MNLLDKTIEDAVLTLGEVLNKQTEINQNITISLVKLQAKITVLELEVDQLKRKINENQVE